MDKEYLNRLKQLSGIIKEDDQYRYPVEADPEEMKKAYDKNVADGLEVVKSKDGKTRMKLKLNGAFTGDQVTVPANGNIVSGVMYLLKINSDLEKLLKDIPRHAIELSLSKIIKDQWFEFDVPIDLTFQQIFDTMTRG